MKIWKIAGVLSLCMLAGCGNLSAGDEQQLKEILISRQLNKTQRKKLLAEVFEIDKNPLLLPLR